MKLLSSKTVFFFSTSAALGSGVAPSSSSSFFSSSPLSSPILSSSTSAWFKLRGALALPAALVGLDFFEPFEPFLRLFCSALFVASPAASGSSSSPTKRLLPNVPFKSKVLRSPRFPYNRFCAHHTPRSQRTTFTRTMERSQQILHLHNNKTSCARPRAVFVRHRVHAQYFYL